MKSVKLHSNSFPAYNELLQNLATKGNPLLSMNRHSQLRDSMALNAFANHQKNSYNQFPDIIFVQNIGFGYWICNKGALRC